MSTLGKQISPKMNQILEIHAEWLDKNVSKLAGDKCREQAKEFRKRGKHGRPNATRDESVQLQNKARKRQKDSLNVAIEATFRLDQEHLEKLAEHIEKLYEERHGEDKKDTSYKIL